MSGPSANDRATPLDLIVLAELLPVADRSAPEYGRPHRIDRDSLDGFLGRLRPTDPLAESAAKISTFREFRPEAMRARWLDARVAEARAKLGAGTAQGATSTTATRSTAAPTPTVASEPAPESPLARGSTDTPLFSDDPLAHLFDLVEAGTSMGAAHAPGASLADRLVAEVVRSVQSQKGGGTPKAPKSASGSSADDALRAEILRAALASPEWRALEGAWLALRTLVRRVDFREGTRLFVVPSAPGAGVRHLRAALEGLSADAESEGRVTVAVVGWESGAEERAAFGAAGREYWVPVISAASSEEVESAVREDRVASSDDATSWSAATAHHCLARPLYGAASEPVKGFAFEEGEGPTLPWIPASWLLALAISRAFDNDGLGTEFTARPGGEIEDLPLSSEGPVDRALPTTQLAQLARRGFAPLAALGATDRAYFPFVPVAAGDDAPENRLAHRVLMARVHAAAVAAWNSIDRSLSAERAAEQLTAALTRALTDSAGAFAAVESVLISDRGIAVRYRALRGSLRDSSPSGIHIQH